MIPKKRFEEEMIKYYKFTLWSDKNDSDMKMYEKKLIDQFGEINGKKLFKLLIKLEKMPGFIEKLKKFY